MITVYTTKTCAYCPMVKRYLTLKGIEFEAVDLTDELLELAIDVCPEQCTHPICQSTKKSGRQQIHQLITDEVLGVLEELSRYSEKATTYTYRGNPKPGKQVVLLSAITKIEERWKR